MKRKTYKRLFTGWGTKGRPFTREQFKKSYIRKSYGGKRYSYKQYIRDVKPRSPRLRKFLKVSMR